MKTHFSLKELLPFECEQEVFISLLIVLHSRSFFAKVHIFVFEVVTRDISQV